MEITFTNLDELKERANQVYLSDKHEENTRYIAMLLYDILRMYEIDNDLKLESIKEVSNILFNKENHTDLDIEKVDDLFWVNGLHWPVRD